MPSWSLSNAAVTSKKAKDVSVCVSVSVCLCVCLKSIESQHSPVVGNYTPEFLQLQEYWQRLKWKALIRFFQGLCKISVPQMKLKERGSLVPPPGQAIILFQEERDAGTKQIRRKQLTFKQYSHD